MKKTLYKYIGNDLLKVTLQTLPALTLVATVLAVLEPLRKQGLGAAQVLSLIVYTLPSAVSLTLPLSALFAATFVYGRLVQDNELMACRASGVGTLGLLRPAIVLGVLTSLITLVLGNFVSPRMLMLAERAVIEDIEAVTYSKLQNEKSVNIQGFIIRAERVDRQSGYLHGVVVKLADDKPIGRDENNKAIYGPPEVVSAKAAQIAFMRDDEGQATFLTVRLIEPVHSPQGGAMLVQEGSQLIEGYRLPSALADEPQWHNWDHLARTLTDPALNLAVRAKLDDIHRSLSDEMLARELAQAINDGKAYDKLADDSGRYVIRAAKATVEGSSVRLAPGLVHGQNQPVSVTIEPAEGQPTTITAEAGIVASGTLRISQQPNVVTVTLSGAVRRGGPDGPVSPEWQGPPLNMPQHIVSRANSVTLADICSADTQVTDDKLIQMRMNDLRVNIIPRLLAELRAEMHSRLVYGLSGLLLVLLGAALGILLKGGQVATAFGISAVPGLAIPVIIMAGRQMATNRDALVRSAQGGLDGVSMGLMVIWSGLVGLAIADLLVYLYLGRR